MNKIAVCGKGGSGKSVLVRLLADGLKRRGFHPIVIDADESNTGLHSLLGFHKPPEPLISLLGGKQKLEDQLADAVRAGQSEMSIDLVRQDMRLSDIPAQYILQKDGICLVNVGKILMALEGCACPMGVVSRSFLKRLILEPGEIAVVDLEAGVEHFGRGVETSIDCVLAVVEPSHESIEVAVKVNELSQQISIADVWAVLNKVPSERIAERLKEQLLKKGIQVIGVIHQNPEIFDSCLDGKPIASGVAAADIDKVLDFLFP